MSERPDRQQFLLKNNILLGLLICLLPGLTACGIKSGVGDKTTAPVTTNWLRDGSITLARPAPQQQQISSDTLLGFLPVQGIDRGNWMAIDPANKIINVMSGSELLARVRIQDIGEIEPGTYGIIHRQQNPLWYAPASYFSRRNLAVPAEGTSERFRKGALGDFALFINKDFSIHNSPVACQDVGGIKLSDEDIALLYEKMGTDSIVEVF